MAVLNNGMATNMDMSILKLVSINTLLLIRQMYIQIKEYIIDIIVWSHVNLSVYTDILVRLLYR